MLAEILELRYIASDNIMNKIIFQLEENQTNSALNNMIDLCQGIQSTITIMMNIIKEID